MDSTTQFCKKHWVLDTNLERNDQVVLQGTSHIHVHFVELSVRFGINITMGKTRQITNVGHD